MHNLARGCPAKRRLPRVRSPGVIHSCRECIWGFGFDSACEQDPLGGRAMPRGRHSGPYEIRHPARSPRPGLCNPYRIEFCLGSVTRGSHVPWQPRARICKSYRLVPAPSVFRCAGPKFGSVVGSPTTSPHRSHVTGFTPHGLLRVTHHPPPTTHHPPPATRRSSAVPGRISAPSSAQRPIPANGPTVYGSRSTPHDCRCDKSLLRRGSGSGRMFTAGGEPLRRAFPAGNRERFRLACSAPGGAHPDSP